MGYDVHITRRQNWFEPDGPEIGLEEWLALVEADPEMRLDGYADAPLEDGSVLRMEDPSLAVWVAYSGHEQDGNMAWIRWDCGKVTVKNPDEEIRRKTWQIAQKLSARVQGDEGEWYGPDGVAIPDASPERGPDSRRRWWKRC